MTKKVFAYGTLKDVVIQEALFGRQIQGIKAHILGWGLYMAPEGYLFVKPLAGGRVDGMILELETGDMKKADLWEDADVYQREAVTATVEGLGEQIVYIYTRRSAEGDLHRGHALHGRDLSQILKDIADLSM